MFNKFKNINLFGSYILFTVGCTKKQDKQRGLLEDTNSWLGHEVGDVKFFILILLNVTPSLTNMLSHLLLKSVLSV